MRLPALRAVEPFHIETPMLHSRALSAVLDAPVYLKMDAYQPTGSFKIRGVGLACQRAVARGAKRLVTSSGGNAGYAVAWAGARLGVHVQVFIPRLTSDRMADLIRGEGATVEVHGATWDDAHAHAIRTVGEDAAYIHPFDQADIWEGHTSLILEAARQGKRPGVIVVSVGGGGLLCGVLQGMAQVGWQDIPVLAVETEGAASLKAALEKGEVVELAKIDTVAVTLGARRVAEEALKLSRRHAVTSWTVTDRAAVSACRRFVGDQRVLVEPACGAALATVYDRAAPLTTASSVLVIVCGGVAVTLEQLDDWERKLR